MPTVSTLRMPLAIAATLAAAAAAPAAAHVGHAPHPESWSSWRIDPDIALGVLVAGGVYLRGALRRERARHPPAHWRHVAFLAGLGAVAIALESPVDPMAERLFWMHQVQHMLLRILAPLLIALSAPQAVLVAGLPRSWRRRALAPLLRSARLDALWTAIRAPVPLFAIYVAALYVWQIPALHDFALLDEPTHWLMHVTMPAAGLMFWSAILDPRDPPQGWSHRVRQAALVFGIFSNMALGAVTTLKTVELYPAYDLAGRLWGTPPMADESAGGFLIWAPSSMMLLVGILLVFNLWNRAEERRLRRPPPRGRSNSAALERPETAEELRLMVDGPNRRTGRLLGAMSASVFAMVFSIAVVVHMLHAAPAMAGHPPAAAGSAPSHAGR